MNKIFVTLLLISSTIGVLSAQTNSTFFLGHSLINFHVPNMVDKLSVAGNETFSYSANIGNGANLQWHWNNPTTGQGDQWDLTLPNGGYDKFIITEAVPLDGHLQYSETYRYTDSLYMFAEQYNPDIRYFIYETWHCILSGNGSTSGGGGYPCSWDSNSTTPWRDRLDVDLPKWESIADSLNLIYPDKMHVIPGGQAMGALYDTIQTGQVPGLNSLFDLFVDEHHLDERGNYFIACVMYAVIHGQSPVGLPNQLTDPNDNPYTIYPTPAQAAVMQEVAWQTVCEYQRDGVDCTSQPPPSTTCTYLAYDGFDYNSNLPIEGLSGSTGWESPWHVQNADATVPGYNIQSSSLNYSDLQVLGNSASGGNAYLTMGRRLNTSHSGPFVDYVMPGDNGIGTATGDTLWTSFVLSKEENNDESAFFSMHDNYTGWCTDCTNEKIAVGYFGSNSNTSGQRYWTLNLNDTYYQSSSPVTVNHPTLFVVRTIFHSGNTEVDVYINPSTLGSNGIPTASISQSAGSENIIRSIGVYLGGNANSAFLDEIRMAESYECVTPDANTIINLPPVAVVSVTPSSGMAPLSVNFQGSDSYDPEGQNLSFEWDFGDGSPISNMQNPSHVYHDIGELDVSLTVTDNTGQSNIFIATVTVLDPNGSFPCQTTVTSLQMASCQSNDGAIRVNAGANSVVFRDASNQVIPPTSANEFHNLAAGQYSISVSSSSNACTDLMDIEIRVDSTTCAGWQAPNCAMEIGTNMSSLADWSVERPFRNLIKNIRPSIISYSDNCACWDGEVLDEMSFDANGYPTYLPQTTSIGETKLRYVISSDGANLRPDSSYVLSYDGTGTLNIPGASVVSNVPNRIEFVAGSGDIYIFLDESTNGDHVRNFRLTTLADEFTDLEAMPFYEVFTDKISPFKVLRFMDWGLTNNNPNVAWEDRSSLSYFTYATSRGVPYEMMIQLANQLNKDVWICVPHMADDNFIAEMATIFRNGLDEDLTIYLEYSNEVWNWIFAQAHYSYENKPSNLSVGRAMAQKAKNVFEIWHDVFLGEECRVKRVLGIQGGYNALNEEILSHIGTDGWDYGSPTHYFGLDHSDQGNPILDASSTYQDVMLNARNNFSQFSQQVRQDYRNIQVHGKEVITYEGGQHFVGNSFGIPYPYQNAMWEAQNSQEMYDMYNDVLDSIRSWGCKLASNFSLATVQESVYGSWGVLPHIDVMPPYMVTAPKYQVLLDNLPSNNCSNQNSWNGKISSLWSNPCNWDKNRVPTETDNVIIPVMTPHSPEVDMSAVANSVHVALGAALTILTGRSLEVD